MTKPDTVYSKTALPVRLDLTNLNTAAQLSSSGAGAAGAGPGMSVAEASQLESKNIMRKDLDDWLLKQGITSAPPSAVSEQRAMWTWIREFHKEYNDDWFSRNMPRLHERFKPIFDEKMKRLKATAQGAKEATPAAGDCDLLGSGDGDLLGDGGCDLLGTGPPASGPPAAGDGDLLGAGPLASGPPAAGGGDLLDLGGPAQASAPPRAPAAGAPAPSAPAPVPAAVAGNTDLLDLFG